MEDFQNDQRSPWRDLMFLLFYSLCCTFVVQLIVIAFGAVLNQGISGLIGGENSFLESSSFFRYSLAASSSIGVFLLPVMWLQHSNKEIDFFIAQRATDWRTYLLAVSVMVAFIPLMDVIAEWNKEMSLPESIKHIEEWMRRQEDSAAGLTEDLIMVSTIDKLLLNILFIAVLPGIAEEFFFRGALQNIFTRIFKNPHLSIWVVGIVFSAIHIQFYGFLPRMILGVFLGYFFLWTGNIWVSVFIHFLNNASVVVAAFFYARNGKNYTEFVNEGLSYSIIVYLGSLIFSVFFIFAMYRYTQNKKRYARRLD